MQRGKNGLVSNQLNTRGSDVLERRFTIFGEITQNKRPYAVQSFEVIDFGHIWCHVRLPISDTNSHILSCAVSKLWPIIGHIFASDGGVSLYRSR